MLSVWTVVRVKMGKSTKRVTKVQILGSLELPNGEIKHELVDLTVDDASVYQPLKNKVISISCGAMAVGRNVVFMFERCKTYSCRKFVIREKTVS